MDETAGRPAKTTRIRSAVHEFVLQNQNRKAAAILRRLQKFAQSGSGEIVWFDVEEVFQHETEAKPQWSKSTMLKEIRTALRRLKKVT